MKIVVLYHPDSDHARSVLTFQHDFEQQASRAIELSSLETPEGDNYARIYGITQYPAVIVSNENGEVLKLWEGETLPQINEVASYII